MKNLTLKKENIILTKTGNLLFHFSYLQHSSQSLYSKIYNDNDKKLDLLSWP